MSDDKTTVVKTGGGGGLALLAVAILALAVVLFLLFGQGLLNGPTKKIDADIKIDTPTKN